jgi:hypothetical protein
MLFPSNVLQQHINFYSEVIHKSFEDVSAPVDSITVLPWFVTIHQALKISLGAWLVAQPGTLTLRFVDQTDTER